MAARAFAVTTQWHEAAIDLGGDAVIADVRMHGIREVDRGRVARQTADLAARREHVDLVGEQVELDALHELLGAAAVRHLHEVLQPLAGAVAISLALLFAGLVLPVRRDA
jgi:hypothetical protein